MPSWKVLWRALIAFIYLRIIELFCAVITLTVILYASKSIEAPPIWEHSPRMLYASTGALSFIGIYYFLFLYFPFAFVTTLALGLTPYFRRTTLAFVNALTCAAHTLWVIHGIVAPLPLSIWLAATIIVIVDGISPTLLPRRLFSH